MQVFVSCARSDLASVDPLVQQLSQAGHSIWLDTELVGGQAWWDTILEHIRESDAVLLILSRASLRSRACNYEWQYALSLGKPCLPVAIGPVDIELVPSDIARLQFLDYSKPSEAAAFQLSSALQRLSSPGALPDPLPDPPPTPFPDMPVVADQLAVAELSQDQQLAIVQILESILGPSAGPSSSADTIDRDVALGLLSQMEQRTDLFPAVIPRIAALRAGALDASLAAIATDADLAAVSAKYDQLDDTARRLWRLSALLAPDESLNRQTAAALLGTDEARADRALREIATVISGPGGPVMAIGDVRFREIAAWKLETTEDGQVADAAYRLRQWRNEQAGNLQPKAQLTRDSWTTQDKLGYRPYADAIAAFIRHPDTRPPLTIGIKGPWGSGKTSLMRMIEKELDPDIRGKRQEIPLSAESRMRVSPRRLQLIPGSERERAEPPRVRNREVLRKAREPTAPASDAGLSLRADPPGNEQSQAEDQWRPTVWFNPWMYQSGEQIWAGFAFEIINQVTRRLPAADRERFWLKLNLARLDRDAVRRRAYRLLLERLAPMLLAVIAVGVVALAVLVLARLAPHLAAWLHRAAAAVFSVGAAGVVGAGIVQFLRFWRESASVAFGGLVSEPAVLGRGVPDETLGLFAKTVLDPGYQTRVGFLHLVQTDMGRVLDLVATPSRPLVIFVDDLDRCSPGPVVQVIEAINLFLAGEFPNCIFVLAMEPDLVAADIEVAYKDLTNRLRSQPSAHGWDTLGWRFLEKIIQLPLSLPAVDDGSLMTEFVQDLLNVPAHQPAGSQDAIVPASADSGGDHGPADTALAPSRPLENGDLAVGKSGSDTSQPAAPPDLGLVRNIESRIRYRRPDLESLPLIAHEVQLEVLGVGGQFADATVAALDHVFADLYSDSEAYQAIAAGLPALGPTNPREVKRYINLFRFYTFISYRKRLDGWPAIPGDQIAKLAVLAIRWPDLLNLLAQTHDDGQTNLKILTQAAQVTAGTSTETASWPQALDRLGISSHSGGEAGRWELLRSFLASGPDITGPAERLV